MVGRREAFDALLVDAVHRDDLDVLDGGRGPRVRLADVSSAEDADSNRHGRILIRC